MDFKYPELTELSFSESTETAFRKDLHVGRKLAAIARDLHQLRLDARGAVGYKVGTATNARANKDALEDSKTPAGALLVALKHVLGPEVAAFEPDTIRTELEDREKLKIPPVNYDKILAAIVLTETPAFYFEASCFNNTIMAFNNEPCDVAALQEPTPAQIAWAVYEAEIILHENSLWEPLFEEDPIVFTATVLFRDGMILAPDILSFAQEALDKMNKRGDGPKKDEIKGAWDAIKDKSKLKEKAFTESELDIQLGKLSACQLYLSEQADNYQLAISKLR